MNINELFEIIQNRLNPEDLSGEFALHGNCIIWTYISNNDSEEIEILNDDDESYFGFESKSSEELLQEAYDNDFALLEELLDELEENDNWSFSDSEINENIISFKIF
jgi:hypothetical protein